MMDLQHARAAKLDRRLSCTNCNSGRRWRTYGATSANHAVPFSSPHFLTFLNRLEALFVTSLGDTINQKLKESQPDLYVKWESPSIAPISNGPHPGKQPRVLLCSPRLFLPKTQAR